SVVHLGSDPALLGFIQRPIGEQSHTYKNIIASGFFTINHVSAAHVEQAHYTSARFEKEISEFKACGFTPRYAMGFTAPFVQEAAVQIGMRFVQEIKIELNDTRLMIGQIDHVFINDGLVDSDGSLRLEDAQVACISGLDTYFQAQRIARFPYAKPNPK
ncbi:MAG: flavin reductase, partial [Planctomycetota bacterium]|nr:flavin reductase [Planctomycetota bacterium]